MKLSPKNLSKNQGSFQYQIYESGSSYLLDDLVGYEEIAESNPLLANLNEHKATLETANEHKAILETANEHKASLENGDEQSTEQVRSNELVTETSSAINFNEILKEIDFSPTPKPMDGENSLSFSVADFSRNIVQIKDSNWLESGDLSKVQILFFGDPSAESIQTSDRNLEGEYFQLLLRIATATKIPLEKFGFITHLNAGESCLSEAKGLANLINEVKPQFIITLGSTAYQFLTNSKNRLSSVHGKLKELEFHVGDEEVTTKILPTFHPEYILINPKIKKTVWEDFQHLINHFL